MASKALNEALAGSALLADEGQRVPQAFLNYLLFDTAYQLIDQGFVRISESARVSIGPNAEARSGAEAAATAASPKPPTGEQLVLDLDNIAQQGILYAYVSNESDWDAPVMFDGLSASATTLAPVVVDRQDYYAFGLTHQQPLPDQPTNSYLYNGKELQRDFDLNWYDYGARFYDPVIGRWHAVDPLADQFHSLSPYNYVANNPIIFVDPDGKIIDGDKERVEDLKSKAGSIKKSELRRQGRLQAKIDRRTRKGRKTKGAERRLANSKSRVSEIDDMLSEISALEKSETVYYIDSDFQDQSDGTSGGTSYDSENDRINVGVSKSYGLHGLAHELKHAYQYEAGQVDFFKETGAPGLIYDITDEISSFKRQHAINPRSLGNVSMSGINQSFVKNLNPVYQQLPTWNLNKNSSLMQIEFNWNVQGFGINLTNGNLRNLGLKYSEANYSNLKYK